MESDSMSVINSTASTLFDIGIKISAKSNFFKLQQLVGKQLSYTIIIQRIQLHTNPSMEETNLCPCRPKKKRRRRRRKRFSSV